MITVESPGTRTLIEDLGRSGHEHLGVPTSGAADETSLRLANRLVGNASGCAALEVALNGPTLIFHSDTYVAYVGADADLHLNGTPIPTGHTVKVRSGQVLEIGALRNGVYGYLAIAGGITTDSVLGSRSMCSLSGLGGAPLKGGDLLSHGTNATNPAYRALLTPREPTRPVRFVRGPHAHLFSDTCLNSLVRSEWSVSADSSRVGVRLAGATLSAPQTSLPSLGMVTGAIQVPPTGTPIVLGPDHGVTGGYPVIGVVVPADIPLVMQQQAGSRIRLMEVDTALYASRANDARLMINLDRVTL